MKKISDGCEMPPNNRMNLTLLISALINGSTRIVVSCLLGGTHHASVKRVIRTVMRLIVSEIQGGSR